MTKQLENNVFKTALLFEGGNERACAFFWRRPLMRDAINPRRS